jgi:hypothetical protein
MDTADLRISVEKLFGSMWAFSALSYAVETGILENLKEPRTISYLNEHTGVPAVMVERVCDVLASLNLMQRQGDTFTLGSGFLPMLSFVIAQMRAHSRESRFFMDSARQPAKPLVWDFSDPEILQSRGSASASFSATVFKGLFPRMGNLIERLQSPSASFLDVGTGVGAIAIAMCRALPNLHVVGLDILATPLVEARRIAGAAGLTDRIVFRQQDVQDMKDNEVFDLAFFPQMFMPEEVVKRGFTNSWLSLRRGGWIMVAAGCIPGMSLQASVSRLRDTLVGGSARIPSQIQSMLIESGFISVDMFDVSETSKLVFGQRPV